MAEIRFIGFRSRPVGRVFQAVAQRFLARQVPDAELRAKLTPDYRIGCKRILISSDFYAALGNDNVDLVTSQITRIEPTALVTADGTRREFDVLVCGTGFDATRPPIAKLIHGSDGRSLEKTWSPHMSALRGTTIAGFPNLFLLVGPNTALGHNSIVYIIEAQLDYILEALELMGARGARSIEPRVAAQDAYNRGIQRDLAGSVWTTGGCTSFYLDSTGRNTTLWPHRAAGFRRALRRFDPEEYVIKTRESVDA